MASRLRVKVFGCSGSCACDVILIKARIIRRVTQCMYKPWPGPIGSFEPCSLFVCYKNQLRVLLMSGNP
jgi:hypothetical protein